MNIDTLGLSEREINLAIYLYKAKKCKSLPEIILTLYDEEVLKDAAVHCDVTYNRVHQVYTDHKEHIHKVRYGC